MLIKGWPKYFRNGWICSVCAGGLPHNRALCLADGNTRHHKGVFISRL